MDDSLNVYDEPLIPCGTDPVTGYFRDGCCNTGAGDHGSHTVCVEVTQEFLEFSRSRGNDLMTPAPQFGFPGLSPGDNWCLCAARWLEARTHAERELVLDRGRPESPLHAERADLYSIGVGPDGRAGFGGADGTLFLRCRSRMWAVAGDRGP